MRARRDAQDSSGGSSRLALEAGARTSLGVLPKLERKRRLRTLVIQCSHNIYTLMFQRLAIANGHGWNRFLHTRRSSLAAPRRYVAVAIDEPTTDDEAAN
jgi:hypothetical protein